MNTRNAVKEDLDRLAVLFDQYRIFYHQSSDLSGARKFLTDRIEKNDSVIFVVLLDHIVVGFTQLYPVFSSVSMKPAWLLNDLFVMPESRGSGASDALLKAAKTMGEADSSPWLLLQTGLNNHRAQRVYERNGWEKDKEGCVFYYHFQNQEG